MAKSFSRDSVVGDTGAAGGGEVTKDAASAGLVITKPFSFSEYFSMTRYNRRRFLSTDDELFQQMRGAFQKNLFSDDEKT
jgi:hypothetical protein